MTLDAQSRYSNRRTYVLKVRSDATPDALAGRIENIVSGQQREFASDRELLDSIASDLRADADQPSAGQGHGKPEGWTP
jgi:hypothetical protein